MRRKLDINDIDGLNAVGHLIRSGGVIVYPTDTVYGIGGDPFNAAVVERIRALKKREAKPLPVLVSSKAHARELAQVNSLALSLMKTFWPGALTIVLKDKGNLPRQLTLGGGSIGIREPDHALALKIIEVSGGSLIGTSANISGERPAKNLDDLDPIIEKDVDLVIEGGSPPGGSSSTVIEIIESAENRVEVHGSRIRIVREGAIKEGVIRKKMAESKLKGIRIE